MKSNVPNIKPSPRNPDCLPYVKYSLLGLFASLVFLLLTSYHPLLTQIGTYGAFFFTMTTFATVCVYLGIDF
jgi:hypothetical protein